MIGDDATVHIDAETTGEIVEAARVFGGHDIGPLQEGHQTGGGVANVADRGCGEHHGAGGDGHGRFAGLGGGGFAGMNFIIAFRHLRHATVSVILLIQLICACHTPSIAHTTEQSTTIHGGIEAFSLCRG